MPSKITLAAARRALRKQADSKKAALYRMFCQYADDDVFLGVTTPKRRAVAKAFRELSLKDTSALLRSKTHEERTLALEILVLKFKKADDVGRKQVFDFFMKHRRNVRSWDEVDGSVPYIVGPYLMERSRAVLHKLVRSKNIWDRRIALVATWPMIRQGDIKDIFKLAVHVLDDAEDLIHKAMGWMLREAGKKDGKALRRFLRTHYARLPRTALRYAIERFPKTERARWLKGPV